MLLLPVVAAAEPVVHPKMIVLRGPESSQQIVVGEVLGGRNVDLTHLSSYRSRNEQVAVVSSQGVVTPVQDGSTEIVIASDRGNQNIVVEVKEMVTPRPVSFRQEIQPILTKAGCNSGGCHGKAEGQNGFRLSLLGFDDEFDFSAVAKESRGRRINPASPETSLFLRKATGIVPHGGGYKIPAYGLWYAKVLRWISEGAELDGETDTEQVRLEVYPKSTELLPDRTQQLQVFAVTSDGNRTCVTNETEFISNTTDVAEVDARGLVQVRNVPGESAILARYRGSVAVARIRLPQEIEVRRPVENNQIDTLVWDRLELLGVQPSELSEDSEFIRRVFIDTIGTLPTSAEARKFLEDDDPEKRRHLIQRLLEREEYADFWAMQWADILRVDRELIQPVGTIAMTRWLREQFLQNRPYDEFVREILTVTGSTQSQSPAAFYLVHNNSEKLARSVSQVFLGVRIECAQCHHHPFEKWGQQDYYAFAGFFTGITQKKVAGQGIKIVNGAGKSLIHPRTGESVPVAGLGAEQAEVDAGRTWRPALAQWMTAKDNPFMARMFVNRLWAHYFGHGLANPIDDMRSTNPASNEPLLEMLAQRFVDDGYDIKGITALLLNSRAYQLSSRVHEGNYLDEQNFSHAAWKAMPAEVLLDAISQVTGVQEEFNGWPAGYRAIEIWDNRMPNYFFKIFGKPQRVSVCECERGNEPSIAQALHLMNAPESMVKIRHRFGAARQLSQSAQTEQEIVEELFLKALSRYPKAEEAEAMAAVFQLEGVDRRTAVEDVLWVLLNTREFVFNH